MDASQPSRSHSFMNLSTFDSLPREEVSVLVIHVDGFPWGREDVPWER